MKHLMHILCFMRIIKHDYNKIEDITINNTRTEIYLCGNCDKLEIVETNIEDHE